MQDWEGGSVLRRNLRERMNETGACTIISKLPLLLPPLCCETQNSQLQLKVPQTEQSTNPKSIKNHLTEHIWET